MDFTLIARLARYARCYGYTAIELIPAYLVHGMPAWASYPATSDSTAYITRVRLASGKWKVLNS